MITLMSLILIIILISRITEETLKIPSALSLIVYAFIASYTLPNLIDIDYDKFDDILYLMLPIILLPDVLNLSIKELKKYFKEIFYLAFIAVIGSIAIATLVTPFILPQYQWSVGVLIALFSMLMATDAITVASIMSKFKLPKRLKIYAETESLFNDVTSLIIFYFIALPLLGGNDISIYSIHMTLIKVLILSTTIGVSIAAIGYFATKILKNSLDQFIILYLVVIISFSLAEHFHIAGILSIVASVLTFKTLVFYNIEHHHVSLELEPHKISIFKHIKNLTSVTKKEFKEHQKEAMFIGIFANGIIFIIISNIINIQDLRIYWLEILAIFFITTVIRFIAVWSMTKSMKLPNRWAFTLTFSGTKGALAIIMSHSLPDDFIYREMFIAIIIGVVLLSTFIYTMILMYHIYKHSKLYTQDMLLYDKKVKEQKLPESYAKNLVKILEKDSLTQAYNKLFIEDILEKEIHRAQRYRIDSSIISFQIISKHKETQNIKSISEIVHQKLRVNDYFGRIDKKEYIILTSHTSLSGAIALSENILLSCSRLKGVKIFFGITKVDDMDTIDTIYEKLQDAMSRALSQEGEQIEIEI